MRRKETTGLSGRVDVYDWVRLFATICVVIGHSTYLNIQTVYGGVAYELPQVHAAYGSTLLRLLQKMSDWVYGFHMPLFFMLSGSVLALKPIRGGVDQICVSKLKRLIFPYILYGWFFMLPVKYLGDFYTKGNLKIAYREFLSGVDSGHLWFLPALFWCILTFVVIYKLLTRFKVDSLCAVLLVSGAVQLCCGYLPFDVFLLKKGLRYVFWFALGYAFERERRRTPAWNVKQKLIALAFLSVVYLAELKYNLLNNFFQIIFAAFWIYLLSALLSQWLKGMTRTRGWSILIRNLFSVYLFHDPLEYIVLKIFMRSDCLSSAAGCYAYFALRTVGVFLASVLLGELVRTMKALFQRIWNGAPVKA